jgi:hypothetical protein
LEALRDTHANAKRLSRVPLDGEIEAHDDGLELVLSGWRGTPQLLAHIIDVLCRAAQVDTAAPGGLVIDLTVKGDHEIFTSVDALLSRATTEALAKFQRIRIEVTGTAAHIVLVMRWVRPWYVPGSGSDAAIELKVDAEQSELEIRKTVLAALVRGWRRVHKDSLASSMLALLFSLAAAFSAGVASYLAWNDVQWGLVLVVWFLGMIGGMFLATWIIPAIEVSPWRQSRFVRSGRAAGSVVLSLALVGLGKAIFG